MPSEVTIPDIGDFNEVPIIEVHVKEGDPVNVDDPLVSLESDKATMEVPAPSAGTVERLLIKVGDRVSQGTPILWLRHGVGAMAQPPSLVSQQDMEPGASSIAPPQRSSEAAPPRIDMRDSTDFRQVHASPSVRRLARELDIDLAQLNGTGEKGRITREDVKAFARGPARVAGVAAAGAGIPEIPSVDFSKFGDIEVVPLARIKKISGSHLHRAWLNVPHVTHQDEADITEMEAFRKELDKGAKDNGFRVTLLAFLMKAAASALRLFPEFNSSLSPSKDSLILKKYYHIGIAVDTADGLVVPVIHDVDRKGIHEISRDLTAKSKAARDGKLTPNEMQGASFTISSLGGVGGTAFSPIVNAPEVAILGVVRSKMAPVWNGEEFRPRLMLPLSLSYDHRVIDGALAARFTRHLCQMLEDVRRLVL